MPRILFSLLLLCLLSPLAVADQRTDTQRQLEQTQKDIAELKKQLQAIQAEKSGVQKQLKSTETQMGDLEKQIQQLQKEMQKNQEELQDLDTEKKKLQSARREQQDLIAIQARAAYQSGNQEYLKLLLNQEQPESFSRTLTYYDYLNRARLEQLATFKETLRQLSNVEQDIGMRKKQLVEQQSTVGAQRQALAKVRQERQKALAKLDGNLRDSNRRLKNRQQDQLQLSKLLKTIEETLARQAQEAEAARLAQQRAQPADAPPPSGGIVTSGQGFGGAFASVRGRLPWPVNGQVLARYGSPRGDDPRATWDGVLIRAARGSPVRAVHGGRVVFADWLRGAGLLVILDHGGGYLSLYGHNQSLLKSAGDIVQAGDALATVGSSGGQRSPAVYFAIRHQGRPADPSTWCRSQG